MPPTNPPLADDSSKDELSTDPAAPPVDRWLLAVTALSVVVGVVLRFLPRSGLWLDEALTANIAALPLGEIGEALRSDGHPPLYYVLLHVWGSIDDSDWWLRSLSGVISVAALPLFYLGGVRLGGRIGAGPIGARRTGLISLALAAVLPFGVRYGSELRMYSLVIALSALGYLLVDDLLSGRRTGRARLLTAGGVALVAGALLWSHYWSMWLLAAVGLVALWQAWRDLALQRRDGARWLAGALVVGGILYLPWLPTMLFQAANTGTPWGERFLPLSVTVVTLVDFAGGRFGAAQFLSYLLVVFALIALMVRIERNEQLVIAMRPQPRIQVELIVVAIAMGLGSITAILSGNTFASRYAAIVFALVVLSVAAGLAVVRNNLLTSLIIAAVLGLSVHGGLGEAMSDRSQSGEVGQAIATDLAERGDPAGAGAIVVSCPDQLAVSLQRELDQARTDTTLSSLGDVVPFSVGGDPRFVDWVDYAERNADASVEDFAALVESRASEGVTIYAYTNARYLTVESKCTQVIDALASGRLVTQLVVGDPEKNFEWGDLRVLGSPP